MPKSKGDIHDRKIDRPFFGEPHRFTPKFRHRSVPVYAVVAQGWEAGDRRGIFDPTGPDARLSTSELLRAVLRKVSMPVIATGGIMDGRGICRMLERGAAAAQLGTAFIGCPESAADAGYRNWLVFGGDTIVAQAISGRPARCLSNAVTRWAEDVGPSDIPAYPCAYDLIIKDMGATAYGASGQVRGPTGPARVQHESWWRLWSKR